MNWDEAHVWVDFSGWLMSILAWIYVWATNKHKATNDRVDEVEEKIAALAVEQGRIDERVKKAIGHAELEPLHLRLNNVDKNMSEFAGEFKGMKHLLELIHEHMLNNGGKS